MWIAKVIQSFRYALEGLIYTVVTQRNMRIHFIAALGVLLLSLYLPVSKVEVLILFVTIIIVLFAELINTVVETVVDMITQEYHPLAKIAKDVAAGAVLLTAGLAVMVGISIFYPYIDVLFRRFMDYTSYPANMGLAAIIAFNFILTLMMKGWYHQRGKEEKEPSMIVSITFCVGTLIIAVIGNLFLTLLVFILMGMLVATRFRLQPNGFPILSGALIGTLVSVLGMQLL
ncbi:diacylglycerol kinase [Hazenella coriacea]|uniref:Diacylglycerol kinase (ATP) n=1 Tax=Hazenella coriacea TaxID=1179467 RepID=A0A4V2UV83_9BACL|nr:diacylglycerol kinase family protein [Hazenella coriacea]TCS94757.1 diacylglycerol kinase (ATP) [Hazenella coriacea]